MTAHRERAGVRGSWLVAAAVVAAGLSLHSCRVASAASAPKVRVALSATVEPRVLESGSQGELRVRAEIPSGWHVNAAQPSFDYLIPTALSVEAPEGLVAGAVRYPSPVERTFQFAGGKSLRVYEGTVQIGVPLGATEAAPPSGRLVLRLRYQACNDRRCLRPATAATTLLVRVAGGVGMADADAGRGFVAFGEAPESAVGRWLAERGYLVTFVLVALGGLALNLTPCVYPLVSVTIGYFARQGGARVVPLALAYVAGIVLSFSALGLAAVATGSLFGAALQRPEVLAGIALLLVALALSNFGLYELRPPVSVMQRLGRSVPGQVGALFMGLTMGVVAAPCVGPMVVGLLVFVGTHRDWVLGTALFGALGTGLGAPYLVLAVLAGSMERLPRAGSWLGWVERALGFVLLGMALYFVEPILPPAAASVGVPVLVASAALYLGFLDHTGAERPRFVAVKRLVGVAGLLAAAGLGLSRQTPSPVGWYPYSEAAVVEARQVGRPVLIDFTAEWCLPCREMDETTFTDPVVVTHSERFTMLRVDMTRADPATDAVLERYDVLGVPTVLVLDESGKEAHRFIGYVGARELREVMGRLVPERVTETAAAKGAR